MNRARSVNQDLSLEWSSLWKCAKSKGIIMVKGCRKRRRVCQKIQLYQRLCHARPLGSRHARQQTRVDVALHLTFQFVESPAHTETFGQEMDLRWSDQENPQNRANSSWRWWNCYNIHNRLLCMHNFAYIPLLEERPGSHVQENFWLQFPAVHWLRRIASALRTPALCWGSMHWWGSE